MKKKLSLKDLEVKSFVTSIDKTQEVKGGEDKNYTEFSCYRYMSCFAFQCITRDDNSLCKAKL